MFDQFDKFTDENGRELTWEEMMSDVQIKHTNKLIEDPEWSEKICIHFKTVITAFSIGIQTAYPWYNNYQMPPNFELVMNKMAILLQNEFKEKIDHECIYISILKLKGVYKRLAMSIPEYVEWNNIGESDNDKIITHYDNTPNKPSFIDLDVPPHNAVIYLRNEERNHKKFDEEFQEKYGDLKK